LAGRVDRSQKEHVQALDKLTVVSRETVVHFHFSKTIRKASSIEPVLERTARGRVDL
jgi:hypothetical protein